MMLSEPDRLPLNSTAAPQSDSVTPDRMLNLALAFWRSLVLLRADDLGVFATLAAGPRTPAVLADSLGLQREDGAELLDALVTLGLVEQDGPAYRNTAEANLYLDPTKPTYIGHWLAMARAAMRTMAPHAAQSRAAGPEQPVESSLATHMWADITDILRNAFPEGGEPRTG